eukprot:213828-Amorphochlora_amoeboformis.AAC.1
MSAGGGSIFSGTHVVVPSLQTPNTPDDSDSNATGRGPETANVAVSGRASDSGSGVSNGGAHGPSPAPEAKAMDVEEDKV